MNTSLITPTPPSMNFDLEEPNWIEIQAVMKKARFGSAPGPNGVPYIVYKRCPQLLRFLLKLLRVISRRGKVVGQWRYSQGIWIPKEERAKKINQFRCISLLNVEGKIFFSLLNRRLVDFLLKNTYIDTSVQKGGIPGMPGVIEHTGVITQLLKEAKANKGDIAVLWLDIKNAYGPIHHSLVQEALKRYHVPNKIIEIIGDYYHNFQMRTVSGNTTSAWNYLERGIITGCTISATLFALAMNMLIKAAEVKCRGPTTRSGQRQPPIRGYMDNMTLTTTSVIGARWLLREIENLISWARMSFNARKSRSLALKKGN